MAQALNISVPITEEGVAFNEAADTVRAKLAYALGEPTEANLEAASADLPDPGYDIYMWALLVTIVTALILFFGRYV